MIRLLALSLGGAVVFLGAGVIWNAELVTRRSLDADTTWKQLMKADDEGLISREAAAKDVRERGPVLFLVILVVSLAFQADIPGCECAQTATAAGKGR